MVNKVLQTNASICNNTLHYAFNKSINRKLIQLQESYFFLNEGAFS